MGGPTREVAAARGAVRTALSHYSAGAPVLVALSGGSDSTALAAATLFVARHAGLVPVCLTVDHGLRPESAREAAAVAAWARQAGFEARVTRVDASGTGEGPEAAARRARYAALATAARSLPFRGVPAPVLLAHTADDQAETVLLGLGRGSGARSLAGMAPTGPLPYAPDVTALRPFLSIRKADLRAALRAKRIPWVEDPTNAPDSEWRAKDGSLLTRSAIRHGALPALERALGPGTVPALVRTARLLRRDADALDARAEELAARFEREVPVSDVVALPEALRTRVFRRLAIQYGVRAGELGSVHLEALDTLACGANGRARVDLPGLAVYREGGTLHFGEGN